VVRVELTQETAVLASGHPVVCVFVNDTVNGQVLETLKSVGVEMIALRCAGYNNVDLKKLYDLGMSVTRVPAYSPFAVAEFAIGLMLTLNRKIHKSYHRIRDFNFSLNGLVGFDMRGKTVGVFGTGKIGYYTIEILLGFGCKVLAVDIYQNADLVKKGVKYVEKDELLAQSDIITLHAPLLPSTTHWLNASAFGKCKDGVIIVNTSRGPLIDTKALLDAVLSGKVGGAGLDVVEGEEHLFFENLEMKTISDNTIVSLIACHNVVITSHQAFLTKEALENIADSTLGSVLEFVGGKRGDKLTNVVKQEYK
jgi:D-lactate dehydrogenase